jgi:hypothetical protein
MLISAFIYLISAILIRSHMGMARTHSFVGLGIILGLSYLTKTIMFPMAFVFLGIAFLASGHNWKAFRNVLVAFTVFVLIGSPYILALSNTKGYFTLGDSGKLNYAWHVNGVPKWLHWEGNPPAGGMPKHPTRIAFPSPTVYEFDGPVGGSYPPFYDPSYWYEGVATHFDLHQQGAVFLGNIKVFFVRFVIVQSGILACLLLIFLASRKKHSIIKTLGDLWFLLLSPFFALLLYLMVHLEQRYLGGYNVIVLCSILLAILMAQGHNYNSKFGALCNITLLIIITHIVFYTIYIANNRSLHFFQGDGSSQEATTKDRDFFSSTPSKVADYLRRGIVEPGDKVACIERLNGMYAFWARLAKVRIVAEIQGEDVEKFWRADDLVQARVIEAFARTGARILVFNLPDYATELKNIDARRIDDTHYYYVQLEN